ncbi:MAG: NAD(P)H-hydrate dehydratase [Roseibium sp.]
MTTALLTPDQMGFADRLTIESGVPGIVLMENAGQAVARVAADHAPRNGRVLVICGPGNNGGDGFIAARILAARGFQVDVGLLKDPAGLKGDAALAFERMGLPYALLSDGDHTADNFFTSLHKADLIIDAMFGAGLDRPLQGPIASLVESVNQSNKPVVAVDLPSGVNGATGEVLGEAIKSHATVTFFCEKPGHILYPGRCHCGDVTVADIGIDKGVLDKIEPATHINAPELWVSDLPKPDPLGHKYSKGHAVVFGGPMSSTGAARLSAMAALRAGAGLVTLASPPGAMMVNASHLTAVMLKKVSGVDAIPEFMKDHRLNAVLIGPGFGLDPETMEAVTTLMGELRATVLDADALTVFEDEPETLFALIRANQSPTIMTPHDGEFARLFSDLVGQDKLSRARKAAERCCAIVVLKGPDTVIAAPDGRAAINCNAPPWLATAGSGDVLAGVALGLLAQGVPGFEAACQAVWLHGEAGSNAGPGLIAEDLPSALKPAIQVLVDNCERS